MCVWAWVRGGGACVCACAWVSVGLWVGQVRAPPPLASWPAVMGAGPACEREGGVCVCVGVGAWRGRVRVCVCVGERGAVGGAGARASSSSSRFLACSIARSSLRLYSRASSRSSSEYFRWARRATSWRWRRSCSRQAANSCWASSRSLHSRRAMACITAAIFSSLVAVAAVTSCASMRCRAACVRASAGGSFRRARVAATPRLRKFKRICVPS